MQKILIIDATGRNNAQSKTKLLSEAVINKMNFKNEQVNYLDLYDTKLPNLTPQILDSRKSNNYEDENSQIALQLLEQFEAADEYIFIFPTWNWSVPAILKQYIDIVMVSNRTFTYKGMRIVGLLESKKATIINTTGGPILPNFIASLSNNQNGVNYMVSLLKIMGIKNIKKYTIAATSYKFKNKQKNIDFDIDLYKQEIEKVTAKISN